MTVDITSCGQTLSHCACVKPLGHVEAGDKVHACDPNRCGGSWIGTENSADFQICSFPDPLLKFL